MAASTLIEDEVWKRVVLKGVEYPREVSNTGKCRKLTGDITDQLDKEFAQCKKKS